MRPSTTACGRVGDRRAAGRALRHRHVSASTSVEPEDEARHEEPVAPKRSRTTCTSDEDDLEE